MFITTPNVLHIFVLSKCAEDCPTKYLFIDHPIPFYQTQNNRYWKFLGPSPSSQEKIPSCTSTLPKLGKIYCFMRLTLLAHNSRYPLIDSTVVVLLIIRNEIYKKDIGSLTFKDYKSTTIKEGSETIKKSWIGKYIMTDTCHNNFIYYHSHFSRTQGKVNGEQNWIIAMAIFQYVN